MDVRSDVIVLAISRQVHTTLNRHHHGVIRTDSETRITLRFFDHYYIFVSFYADRATCERSTNNVVLGRGITFEYTNPEFPLNLLGALFPESTKAELERLLV